MQFVSTILPQGGDIITNVLAGLLQTLGWLV
ncbi:hypothetical protein EV191_107239 [Tamaricihabitans halophyticus]|uniref:Uncharacterized protein n=1 Tax=Tamaricihabitans halophyticus TaxID=1262583 RepID=A0A4R2QV55_9PSEU|nr:hypothetical protein EV191_107239 [Tamaricihabitans halophyticus]